MHNFSVGNQVVTNKVIANYKLTFVCRSQKNVQNQSKLNRAQKKEKQSIRREKSDSYQTGTMFLCIINCLKLLNPSVRLTQFTDVTMKFGSI